MKHISIGALALFAALIATGCGSAAQERSSTPAPTLVTASDLDKDGTLWSRRTPDLKDDLVELGKSRLGDERPDGATGIRAFRTDDLVAEIEKQ